MTRYDGMNESWRTSIWLHTRKVLGGIAGQVSKEVSSHICEVK